MGARAQAECARIAPSTASQSASGLCSATSPSRTVAIGREALAAIVPSSATRAGLAFVVLTSIPSAWLIAECRLGRRDAPRSASPGARHRTRK